MMYEKAPYEACDEETYNELAAVFPDIDWSKLGEYEQDDKTTSSQEVACSGPGGCEL